MKSFKWCKKWWSLECTSFFSSRMIHFLLLDIDAVKQIYLCCQKYWSIYVSSIYMSKHTLIYISLIFCYRCVFLHTEQFLNCSSPKVVQLLYSSTVFCLRKQSLIFQTHQQLYQAESLPGSSLPLCLWPGSDGSAEGGGMGQQQVWGHPLRLAQSVPLHRKSNFPWLSLVL